MHQIDICMKATDGKHDFALPGDSAYALGDYCIHCHQSAQDIEDVVPDFARNKSLLTHD